MEYEAFSGGVEPGGLRTTYEINILICYLLKTVDAAFTTAQLAEILQHDGLVNYFELANSLNELVRLEQIKAGRNDMGEDCYHVTELGAQACGAIERAVSVSVRDKAVKAAIRLMKKVERERKNKVEITQVKDGYNVDMRILDYGSDLMELKLFLPDSIQANLVKRQFLNDPQLLYRGVLSLLVRDLEEFGGLESGEDDSLFNE
ncbi:MAG: DUF4364 family protein [Acetanaerobacterium sp.]